MDLYSQKPIVALLLVPSNIDQTTQTPHSATLPKLQVTDPALLTPDSYWILKRYTGRILDRIVGYTWSFFWFLGLGNAVLGIVNFILGLAAWRWLGVTNTAPASPTITDIDIEG